MTRSRSTSAYGNNAAKLPALPTVRLSDPQMQRFADALRSWIDARSGALDPWERAVTMRDLVQLGLMDKDAGVNANQTRAIMPPSVLVQTPNGGLVMSIDAFAKSIYDTALFRDMMKRLDDPTRFERLPSEIQAILKRDIADEAGQRGADIRRLESKIQEANKSLAFTVTEITAAVEGSMAGVRETTYATATESRAAAGKVTQIEARLDDFDGGSATIEEVMSVNADRTTGLEAQYTLKVQAGSKIAGFGIAATDNGAGNATSAFIVSADKFAIVGAADSIPDPLAPPLNRIPFGIDTVNNVIYINGQVRINTGGVDGGPISDIGERGTIIGYGTNYGLYYSSSWADGSTGTSTQRANRVIHNLINGLTSTALLADTSHLKIGDTVTLTNTAAATAAITKYWSGTQWVSQGVVIDGNLLVAGTLSASKISAGTLTTSSIDTSGYGVFNGYPPAGSGFTYTSLQANVSGLAFYGLVAYAGTAAGIASAGVYGMGRTGKIGVVGEGGGGIGVVGIGTGVGGVGIQAIGSSGALALDVSGDAAFYGAVSVSSINVGSLVTLSAATPRLRFNETDVGADLKQWEFRVDGSAMILYTLTDAGANAGYCYAANRSGDMQIFGKLGIGNILPLEALDINSDKLRIRTAKTPASATATGSAGQICWDTNYLYVCTATNTWKRVALATW